MTEAIVVRTTSDTDANYVIALPLPLCYHSRVHGTGYGFYSAVGTD